MAAVVAAQAVKVSRAAAAQGHGSSRPEGASPAAQALAPRKTSRFLLLFRKLAAGARPAPAEGHRRGAARHGWRPAADASSGQGLVRRKEWGSPAGELRAEAAKARSTAARRSRKAPAGAGEEPDAAASAPAAPAASPRRAEASAALAAPAEVRREQRPAQARVIVVDLRTRPVEAEKPAENRRSFSTPAAEGSQRSFERVLLAREPGTAELGASAQRPAAGSGPASRSGQDLLRERLVPEIVHQAGIILRDGGEGEIRLVLKPEHLGSVRILLRIGESSLEGRIVVDNGNVKELLDSHLEQLKSALRQEGWASANINVTVSGGGGERRDLPPEPLRAVSGPKAGEFERATPAMLDLGFTTVNLWA